LFAKPIRGSGCFCGIDAAMGRLSGGFCSQRGQSDVLWNLGATLIPSQCILWALMLWALFYYRIDRERHQANLAQLQR